jgi:hypothetical protein
MNLNGALLRDDSVDVEIGTQRDRISRRGWRKAEPGSEAIPLERPRGLQRMAELLYGDPVDAKRLAADAALPPRLVAALLDLDAVLTQVGEPEQATEHQGGVVLPLRPRAA